MSGEDLESLLTDFAYGTRSAESLVQEMRAHRDDPPRVFECLDKLVRMKADVPWVSLFEKQKARAAERSRNQVLTDLWLGNNCRNQTLWYDGTSVKLIRSVEPSRINLRDVGVALAALVLPTRWTLCLVVCAALYLLSTPRLFDTKIMTDFQMKKGFSGRWIADKADDPEPMLKALGVPWALRKAISSTPNVKNIKFDGDVWTEEGLGFTQTYTVDSKPETQTNPVDGSELVVTTALRPEDNAVVSDVAYQNGLRATIVRSLENDLYTVHNTLTTQDGETIVSTSSFVRDIASPQTATSTPSSSSPERRTDEVAESGQRDKKEDQAEEHDELLLHTNGSAGGGNVCASATDNGHLSSSERNGLSPSRLPILPLGDDDEEDDEVYEPAPEINVPAQVVS